MKLFGERVNISFVRRVPYSVYVTGRFLVAIEAASELMTECISIFSKSYYCTAFDGWKFLRLLCMRHVSKGDLVGLASGVKCAALLKKISVVWL